MVVSYGARIFNSLVSFIFYLSFFYYLGVGVSVGYWRKRGTGEICFHPFAEKRERVCVIKPSKVHIYRLFIDRPWNEDIHASFGDPSADGCRPYSGASPGPEPCGDGNRPGRPW